MPEMLGDKAEDKAKEETETEAGSGPPSMVPGPAVKENETPEAMPDLSAITKKENVLKQLAAVPDDEPVFMVRATNPHAVHMLKNLETVCRDEDYRDAINYTTGKFILYVNENKIKMRCESGCLQL